MKTRGHWPPPTYRVSVEAHDVPPRWRIKARTVKLPAPNGNYARRRVIEWTHSDAGVPPWKPCMRVSWPYTTAKLVAPSELQGSVTTLHPRSRNRERTNREAA